MEFPNLGSHCSISSCNKLDFLPVKCDACGKVFCNEHYSYASHDCPNAAHRDVQVPICPLCGIAVPVRRGEQPDIKVNEHIDNNCTSDVALSKRKVYANKCSMKGCKRKEMVPISCPDCGLNFCLAHRIGPDHNCPGRRSGPGGGPGPAGLAAMARAVGLGQQKSNPPIRAGQTAQASRNTAAVNAGAGSRAGRSAAGTVSGARMGALQGGLSEDEALARALQLSMSASDSDAFGASSNLDPATRQQMDEDEALARALEASERESRRQGILASAPSSSGNKNCNVS